MEIVFFDASVLFKAAVTRFLLGAAQSGEYRAIWSNEVIEEARRNLQSAQRMHALVALEQNLQLVRDPLVAAASTELEESFFHTHVKDRHVLAAAAGASATLLVTLNVKDFDREQATRHDVGIVTPDEFATSLAARNPHALLRHVRRTPSERLGRYVDVLTRELPTAMGIIRPMFEE